MAKPIAVTPVLHGEAANKFLQKINSKENASKKSVPAPKAKDVISRILVDAKIR